MDDFALQLIDAGNKKLIKAITTLMDKPGITPVVNIDNKELKALLDQHCKEVQALIKSLSSVKPEVNVTTNQIDVIKSIQKMTAEILTGLQIVATALNTKPTSYHITVNRDANGLTKDLTIKAQ